MTEAGVGPSTPMDDREGSIADEIEEEDFPKQTEDIWTIALNMRDSEDGVVQKTQKETNLVFVGGRGAGKSTLVYNFLEKNGNPQPTLALEYLSGKRPSSKELGMDIVHVWEVGGGVILQDLITVPLSAANLPTTAVVIVADLSEPGSVVSTVLEWISIIHDRLDTLTTGGGGNGGDPGLPSNTNEFKLLMGQMRERAWRAYGDHVDKSSLHPCPLPLVIVCNKYDTFRSHDTEQLRLMARTLRLIAHMNGALLVYTSEGDTTTTKRVKKWLSHYSFGTPAPGGAVFDHTTPLIVPPGADTIADIGVAPEVRGGASGRALNSTGSPALDAWIAAVDSVFPPVDVADPMQEGARGELDFFAEPAIDSMRADKDAELERYKQKGKNKTNVDGLIGFDDDDEGVGVGGL